MSKRIHKLIFLISLNVNGDLVVQQVRKDESSRWFLFDDDHQDPDIHNLISKRIHKVKLKKVGNSTKIEHYFTESELKCYLKDGRFIFNGTPLTESTESNLGSKKFKTGLDYRNLNYIDFFKQFDKDIVGLSSSDKFQRLEQLVMDDEILNNIKIELTNIKRVNTHRL